MKWGHNADYLTHFQSNSNWILTLTVKSGPNIFSFTSHNPNTIHSTDHTNPISDTVYVRRPSEDYDTLCMNNIIYTPLCTIQQIYYIHNVVQMQLISYIYNTFY